MNVVESNPSHLGIGTDINLPTVPPTETEFNPVFVYLPNVEDKLLNQTAATNKRIIQFFKEMNIVPPEPKEKKQRAVQKTRLDKVDVVDADAEAKDIDQVALLSDNSFAEKMPPFEAPFKYQGRIPVSSYYMNNRKTFVQFVDKMFNDYRLKLLENTDPISCDDIGKTAKMDLMTHQKLIRDYMNLYTPYRGLLLIHGLGSGKTCSSIGIAEGFRNTRKIIVMTPAYLQSNYISEIKKCGDMLYRLKQHWEFIQVDSKGKDNTDKKDVARLLGLSDEFVKKAGGFWLMDVSKSDVSNYDLLADADKKQLDEQLDQMIRHKYSFINYNGITVAQFNKLTNSLKTNIFDNAVVIIDEVHNFVSWIVNKINTTKNYATLKKPPMAISFYKMLMEAQRCRIVMLSGTPVMNYPNEVAVLFNMLRGYIYTFTIALDDSKVQHGRDKTFDTKYFTNLLTNNNKNKKGESSGSEMEMAKQMVDYVQYNQARKTLTVTRNPLEFENEFTSASYAGVAYNPESAVDLVQFKQNIMAVLNNANFSAKNITMEKNLALPDQLEDFRVKYLDLETREIKHLENFKRRIIGLVSYFRSADEALLPAFDKKEDIHPEYVNMSDLQFGIYAKARIEERQSEKATQLRRHMKGVYADDSKSTSSYRIYSRLFCNFVFPPALLRPIPAKKGKKKGDEDADNEVANVTELEEEVAQEDIETVKGKKGKKGKAAAEGEAETEDMVGMTGDKQYNEQLRDVFAEITAKKDEYLRMPALLEYSPKYAKILENIRALVGKHLVYSQFRTMEGIGLFALSLEANGFQQFRIRRAHGSWELDMDERDLGKKPMYGLYTGTEDKEEREIVRHIFNGNKEQIPKSIQAAFDKAGLNNFYGDIIKVFMITASGSEGINLMETRWVHIMEPFWHAVRTEQVIGRARRICSHKNLPLEHQTVGVFLYMMQFTKKQLAEAPEINKHDVGMLPENSNRPLTSDEKLYETGQIKEQINSKLIFGMKEASIDCSIYTKNNSQEGIQCLTFPGAKPDDFIYTPNYQTDPDIIGQRRGPAAASATAPGASATAKMVARIIQDRDKKKYVHDPSTQAVYEYDTYADRRTRKKVGHLDAESGHIRFDKA